jgi:hypothetical protein
VFRPLTRLNDAGTILCRHTVLFGLIRVKYLWVSLGKIYILFTFVYHNILHSLFCLLQATGRDRTDDDRVETCCLTTWRQSHMTREVGFEPTTYWLTANHSTAELLPNIGGRGKGDKQTPGPTPFNLSDRTLGCQLSLSQNLCFSWNVANSTNTL